MEKQRSSALFSRQFETQLNKSSGQADLVFKLGKPHTTKTSSPVNIRIDRETLKQ